MKINVKDPQSREILELEANPAENDKEPGWSVILPAGNSVFITLVEGEWEARHNETIEPDFLKAIGEAINPLSGNQKNTMEIPKNPETSPDDSNIEKLSIHQKEAEISKRNLPGNEPKP
ncbi:hypothetical protein WG906_06680 [Pedobacter sp. P351]|uniref:hypothetical protein n=1 Tax=Pedobacter superstes TaxID=3133441 RepID=UPI00309AE12C